MTTAGTQVAVIGGGVVGCAVAHALAPRGVQAVLLGAGVFASLEEAAARLPPKRVVEPHGDQPERTEQRARWRAFVRASADL
jgi:glycine/D-amino acid oxidase-like deaminating enzyme